ncbi:hypothetical protein BGX26_009043, partial [Mortierella sp. AD094]
MDGESSKGDSGVKGDTRNKIKGADEHVKDLNAEENKNNIEGEMSSLDNETDEAEQTEEYFTDSLADWNPEVNDTFDNITEAVDRIKAWAITKGFQMVLRKSDPRK